VDSEIVYQLVKLNAQATAQTPGAYLKAAAQILHEASLGDLIVCYELIPETGGVPRVPALWYGQPGNVERIRSLLDRPSHTGLVGQLIHRWATSFHDMIETQERVLHCLPGQQDGYTEFIRAEGIKTFVFIPLGTPHAKLGALFLNYRTDTLPGEDQRWILEACSMLLEAGLSHIDYHSNTGHAQRSRMATAHTLYNEIANRFRGQIQNLETIIQETLCARGETLPPNLSAHLEMTKRTVFEVMRDLVIRTSGDLLIDLDSMTLYKALNTAGAALERAWPPQQRIKIDIRAVPPVIERQSLKLRQLLYALVLETVGNAIKHGGPAPYVYVEVSWHNRHVYVRVLDHGQGFDPAHTRWSELGLGFWHTMITEHLGGAFRVSSEPGHGTVVVAEIPLIPARR
jgi:nitrate/nitrite-specific signal transduction histidine kinase